MRLLIMHGEIETTTRWQVAFGARGHHVRRARSIDSAEQQLREDRFDLLVFDFLVDGHSCLSTALLAQFHQPHIVSVLVSARAPRIQGDMFARLASLRCVLGDEISVSDLVAICEELTKGVTPQQVEAFERDRGKGESRLAALEALYRGRSRADPDVPNNGRGLHA
ncbi:MULTISPECIES: hypothetical protein [Pacificibacter]|uniref:hypothetical protein n=1 Tax=Pacificibacter TaxID=1042323 RepID=UPI001C0836F3|nr:MULTISPECIES: hypothetical protein [Pacificibacter]MBU2935388.1 hypothetical protein [Pacificibacter marinus]MDO6615543.1 hypothetical protein [Pacificibacter sp. 1_MG-2023]